MRSDLTIHEAINDPMIVQLLQADNVPVAAFVQLLQSAARIQKVQVEREMLYLLSELENGSRPGSSTINVG
ncbi:hypothetical protein ACQKKX_02200 [Neorhizobium sp. NPDC001467]|uniref:hypothetical protein n=1 Tax=Neorhizobium sp. NPDC001467 TaxID=3390595 RepID=UPI003D007FE0